MAFRLHNNWEPRKTVGCRTGRNLPVVSGSWNPLQKIFLELFSRYELSRRI